MRRRLLIGAIFLLAGAVVNVGVAWGCAAWLPFEIWGSVQIEVPGFSRLETVWFPREKDAVAAFSSDEAAPAWVFGVFQKPGYRGVVTFLNTSQRSIDLEAKRNGSKIGTPIPSAWLAEITERSRDPEIWTRFDACGWPMRSLWCGVSAFNGPGVVPMGHALRFFGGIPLQPSAQTTMGRWWSPPHALPLRPIWTSFAVNTFFYTGILWLVIPGPFALRRLIRKRRGLCPACGYDLRHGEHVACPECGLAA